MEEQLNDFKWMQEALSEARKGVGLTSPNPPVGSIVVKNGVKISSGWHRLAGKAHAEKEALSSLSNEEAQNSTIYVTLEPCSTEGRTGSCTAALIAAGVARVVYAMDDPNPNHVGRSRALLEKEGISVTSGILAEEAKHLIRGFAMVQQSKRPWIIAKTAISLDGRITRLPEESQWLTSPEAREEVQLLRAEVDVIITSGETVRQDNPALTLRNTTITEKKEQPLRVVMTRGVDEFTNFQILQDSHREKTVIERNKTPKQVLEKLAHQGYCSALLECGGELMGQFLDDELIDEFMIFYAPMLTGGPKSGLAGRGAQNLKERFSFKKTTLRQIGPDLLLRGIVNRDDPKPLDR